MERRKENILPDRLTIELIPNKKYLDKPSLFICPSSGVVYCTICKGYTKLVCAYCEGYFEVKFFIQLKVEFFIKVHKYYIEENKTDVPIQKEKARSGFVCEYARASV